MSPTFIGGGYRFGLQATGISPASLKRSSLLPALYQQVIQYLYHFRSGRRTCRRQLSAISAGDPCFNKQLLPGTMRKKNLRYIKIYFVVL